LKNKIALAYSVDFLCKMKGKQKDVFFGQLS